MRPSTGHLSSAGRRSARSGRNGEGPGAALRNRVTSLTQATQHPGHPLAALGRHPSGREPRTSTRRARGYPIRTRAPNVARRARGYPLAHNAHACRCTHKEQRELLRNPHAEPSPSAHIERGLPLPPGRQSIMTTSRHPKFGARADGPSLPEENARPKPASDDRPTTPPPFDVEAFARLSLPTDPDIASPSEPIGAVGPPPLPAIASLGPTSSLGAFTTTRPVTSSRRPSRRPSSARADRTFMVFGGLAAFGLLVFGIATMVAIGRARGAARTSFAAVHAAVPPLSPPVGAPSPDLPVVLTVVRAAASSPPVVRAPAPQARSPQATPTGLPDCQPPYVVDGATGKKRWKLECL